MAHLGAARRPTSGSQQARVLADDLRIQERREAHPGQVGHHEPRRDPIDPRHAPRPTNDGERLLFRQLYETLVNVDCAGRVRPALAGSWRLDANERTWIVTLRDDSRFADGSPLTADDVRASLSGDGNRNQLHPVEAIVTKFLHTMPGCLTKTVQSVRKHKLFHWDLNRETNRAWLGLNMMTEARAGFRAFHEGTGKAREVDFVRLRQALAAGERWGDDLVESILPPPIAGIGERR